MLNQREMQVYLSYLGISTADMGEAQMRAELQSRGYDTEGALCDCAQTVSVAEFSCKEGRDEDSCRLHSHSFLELVYYAGTGAVAFDGGTERFRVEKNSLLLVMPAVCHREQFLEGDQGYVRRMILRIDGNVLLDPKLHLSDLRIANGAPCAVVTLNEADGKRVRQMLQTGLDLQEKRAAGWRLHQAGIALQLLGDVFRMLHSHPARHEDSGQTLLERLLLYIEDNYAEAISLEKTAEYFYVSKSTITHLFREKLNTSYHQYVTMYRLSAAKTLISMDIPLGKVSQQVGFGDYQTFYRAFRKAFGITPGECRRKLSV